MVNREVYVKNYFTKRFPVWAVLIAALGLLFMTGGSPGLGFILILIGGAATAFLYFMKKTATDTEVDNIVAEELEKIEKRGLNKIGLDESEVDLISPIVIRGSYKKDLNQDAKAHFRKGNDDKLRYSLLKAIVFYFSEKQVYCYTNVVDIVTGKHYQESTDEYFYSDIVSVSTLSAAVEEYEKKYSKLTGRTKITAKKRTFDIESFQLTTSGGTSISAVIRDEQAESTYGGTMETESTENKIKAMRNLLRERKSNSVS